MRWGGWKLISKYFIIIEVNVGCFGIMEMGGGEEKG